jgi:hypothetical protein
MALRRLKAARGFVDLRHAIASMQHRMYMSGVPAWVTETAEAHAATFGMSLEQIAELVKIPADPPPITLIIDALQSKHLKLFVYSQSGSGLVPVPSSSVTAAMERTGFLRPTAGSATCRFMDFYPRRVLNGVEIPGFRSNKFHHFAFCLKERVFDEWLASIARRSRWPLDVKRHAHSGRPALDHLIRPVLHDLVVSGRWTQDMRLKGLVDSIRLKINGPKIDRETVKRVMDDIYRETGDVAYRYVRRTRRASRQPRTRPD